MKLRKTLLLSAIVVLGGALAVQLSLGRSGSVKTITIATDPDEVSILSGDTKVDLKKKDGAWVVGDRAYPADAGQVDSMIQAAKKITVLEKVSAGSDAERFGFVQTGGTVVTLSAAGKELRKLELGKAATTARQTYLRIDGSPDILLVSGNLKQTFGVSADALRDKQIFNLKPADIASVTVKSKESYTLTKEGNGWAVTEPVSKAGSALDGAKVDSWVGLVASLKADGYAPEGPLPTTAAVGSLVFKTPQGETTLTIHSKGKDGKYLCSSSASPYPFYAAEFTVERYLKPLEEVLKK